MTDRW